MNERRESLLTATIVVAAMGIVGVNVYRALTDHRPTSVASPAPTYYSDWKAFAKLGIRIGDSAAKIQIIEFADFECPYCRQFNESFRELKRVHGPNVSLIFVHFPLDFHRFARPAARVAECADRQGRFAEMQALIFDKQDSLGLKTWLSYAVEAGIQDTIGFALCAKDTARMARVEAGATLGQRLNVIATPTILVNGWRFTGIPDSLRAIVARIASGRDPGRQDYGAAVVRTGGNK